MDWALALLLLPVAYYSGYRFGLRDGRELGGNLDQPGQTSQSAHYLDGLNYLLNEEQDKAIALLEQLPDAQTERFETQLALGNLFRRRGELERAIRLHQNLSTRPLLSTDQRALALSELGEDFMRAGLLDRAESLYLELIDIDRPTPRTLRALMSIYEQERDWQKAANAAENLVKNGDHDAIRQLAHYHCESACAALKQDDIETATLELAKAERANPHALRNSLLSAALALKAAPPKISAASQHLSDVVDSNALFVSEALPLLRQMADAEADQDPEQPQSKALLIYFQSIEKGSDAALEQARRLQHTLGAVSALEFLQVRLRDKAQLRVLAAWLALQEQQKTADESIIWTLKALQQALGSGLTHRCSHCGFGTTALHWQCPSCRSWDTCKPLVRS